MKIPLTIHRTRPPSPGFLDHFGPAILLISATVALSLGFAYALCVLAGCFISTEN